jgi:hypothetical protein
MLHFKLGAPQKKNKKKKKNILSFEKLPNNPIKRLSS